MIAHFALMGDLYQYDPYETEASLWNSYPWRLGSDNGIDVGAGIPVFTMAKMIWDIDDSDSSIGASSATLGEFGMFSSLILLDNFSNIGSDAGNNPGPNPYSKIISITGGSVFGFSSLSATVKGDSSAIALSVTGGSAHSFSSFLETVQETPQPEPSPVVTGGNVFGFTSTQV